MAQEVVQSITTMWRALAPKTLWLLALRFRAAITVPTVRMLVSSVQRQRLSVDPVLVLELKHQLRHHLKHQPLLQSQ